MQCVASKADLPEDVFARCASVTQESAIAVTGTVREDKRAPSGVELTLTGLEVIAPSHGCVLAGRSVVERHYDLVDAALRDVGLQKEEA